MHGTHINHRHFNIGRRSTIGPTRIPRRQRVSSRSTPPHHHHRSPLSDRVYFYLPSPPSPLEKSFPLFHSRTRKFLVIRVGSLLCIIDESVTLLSFIYYYYFFPLTMNKNERAGSVGQCLFEIMIKLDSLVYAENFRSSFLLY